MNKKIVATTVAAAVAATVGIGYAVSDNDVPVVYFTKDISPEGLVKAYNALNWTPKTMTHCKPPTSATVSSN